MAPFSPSSAPTSAPTPDPTTPRPGRHRAPERDVPEPPTIATQIGRRGVLGLLAAAGVGSIAAFAESGGRAEATPITTTTPDPAPGVSITVDHSTGFPIADIRQSVG